MITGKIDPSIFEQWELKLEIARPRLAKALGSDYEADEEIRGKAREKIRGEAEAIPPLDSLNVS